MITKEALLARRTQIDADIAAQQQAARDAQAQIQDGQRKVTVCRDMINALSGAKQDVEHWLAQLPPDPPAVSATNVEGTDGGPIPVPAKESLN